MKPVRPGTRRVGSAVALVAALTACGGARRPVPPDAVDGPPNRDSLMASLHAFGRSFGESRAEITNRLGTPDSTRTRVLPNRHVEGAVDTAIVLRYPYMRFELLRPGPTARDLLVSTEVWERSLAFAGAVRIGSTTARVLETALGAPTGIESRGDTTVFTYAWPPMDAEDAVRFYLVRDTLRAVGWGFYFD